MLKYPIRNIGQSSPKKGAKGDRGSDGSDGASGPRGPSGPAGRQGVKGPRGTKGDRGPQGLDGNTGPIGPRGPRGHNAPTATYLTKTTPLARSEGGSGLKVDLRQGAAKAWVRYKSNGGNAVRDSYNTSSNIDYGGGKTGFVFNNHMQSNKYAVAAIADAQIYRGLSN